jgi:hypothetical protein
MKKLDWKSLAIGVLLTTTIVACVGAKNTTNEQWDNNQKWDIKVLDLPFNVPEGYEPFSTLWIGDLSSKTTVYGGLEDGLKKRPQVYVRKRIQ